MTPGPLVTRCACCPGGSCALSSGRRLGAASKIDYDARPCHWQLGSESRARSRPPPQASVHIQWACHTLEFAGYSVVKHMTHSACKLPPTRHFVRKIFGIEPAVARWRLLEAGTLRTFGSHPPCVMPQPTAAAAVRARDRRLCPEALRHEALDQLAHVVRERSHERHVRQRLVVELGEQRTMSAGGQSFMLSGRSPPKTSIARGSAHALVSFRLWTV